MDEESNGYQELFNGYLESRKRVEGVQKEGKEEGKEEDIEEDKEEDIEEDKEGDKKDG